MKAKNDVSELTQRQLMVHKIYIQDSEENVSNINEGDEQAATSAEVSYTLPSLSSISKSSQLKVTYY